MTDIKHRTITKQDLYRHLGRYKNKINFAKLLNTKKLIDAEQIVNYTQLAEIIGE